MRAKYCNSVYLDLLFCCTEILLAFLYFTSGPGRHCPAASSAGLICESKLSLNSIEHTHKFIQSVQPYRRTSLSTHVQENYVCRYKDTTMIYFFTKIPGRNLTILLQTRELFKQIIPQNSEFLECKNLKKYIIGFYYFMIYVYKKT